MLDPELLRARFRRVVELAKFSQPSRFNAESLDVERLLSVRESRECRDFRFWLLNSSDVSDEEIVAQLSGIRARIGNMVHGRPGKFTRWLASTGLGLLPGVGAVAGGVLGLFDAFLLERVVPRPGPLAFINGIYPSIYR